MSSEWRMIQGDCRKAMAAMPEASADSIVCDPPYFLTNSIGSGFMGKSWDSLSPVAAVVVGLLKCADLDCGMVEGDTVAAPANTIPEKGEKSLHAPSAAGVSEDRRLTSSPSISSVQGLVITKVEALALCGAWLQSLTGVIAVLPNHARFVASRSRLARRGGSIARVVASSWLEAPAWLESAISFSRTATDTKSVTVGRSGLSCGEKFIAGTAGSAESAKSDVGQEKSSVTTSCHGSLRKTIERVTSSPCVLNVMRECIADPKFIPALSESFHSAWAREALRVAKPGAYLVAFGGTRTYHRLACAIEDAGWEIRDSLCWLYGSGFPKSMNVPKAIDKAARAERPRERRFTGTIKDGALHAGKEGGNARTWNDIQTNEAQTDAAKKWSGWGTALKPAWEPIILARKPLSEKTVAANILKHGTGGLNIDGCRIGFSGKADEDETKNKNRHADFGSAPRGTRGIYGADNRLQENYEEKGRWPANVVLDEAAAAMLDEQSGETKSTGGNGAASKNWKGDGHTVGASCQATGGFGDTGGASRFFYTSKAGAEDRLLPDGSRSKHPTVKPTDLMSWLVRLVTPPGGTVLDPFAGSGSTGVAAVAGGWSIIGIEIEPEYVAIARARIGSANPMFSKEAV